MSGSGVTELLRRSIQSGMWTGVAAAWGSDPKTMRTVAVGYSSIGPGRHAVACDTWFDLASLTKPLVTTSLALLALRRSLIRLDTRVGEVLTLDPARRLASVTVEQLLTHTSGLPAWHPYYAVPGTRTTDRASALFHALQIEPDSDPGLEVTYSCPGFIVMGFVLEAVLGDRLDRLFQRDVAEPFGLCSHLGYLPDPIRTTIAAGSSAPAAESATLLEMGLDSTTIPDWAHHLPDDGNARYFDGVAGNAGLFGNLFGVFTLAAQYLPDATECHLFSSREIERATRCRTTGMAQDRGLGWQLASSPVCSAGSALSPSAYGHTGFTGTSLWIDPGVPLIMVLLGHRHHPAHRGIDLHPLRRRFHTLCVEDICR
jgi:CubicO group peptidase (beta-lactamase class C family)